MQHELAWDGTGHEGQPDAETVSYVDLCLASRDSSATWQRCTLTADFLAGFLAPAEEQEHKEREELSVVIDELLANALKFSVNSIEPVSMTVQHFGDAVRVEASNVCDAHQAKRLVESLRRVIEENLEDLFVSQIEASATDGNDSSQLGFITLRMNFGARLGARVRLDEDTGHYRVTVAVLMDRHGGGQ